MKAHLLYADQDFDLERPLPWNQEALVKDLSLATLFSAMARDDASVFDVSKKVILLGFDNGLQTIARRQYILQDCLNQPAVIRKLYALAVEVMAEEKKHWLWSHSNQPDSVLRYGVELMEAFLGMLKTLRQIADTHADQFVSEGWTTLFSVLKRELDDEYLASVQNHLKQLHFRRGTLMSAQLGKGNKGDRYVLRQPPARSDNWLSRFFTQGPPAFGFTLHPRDEAGARALSELRDQGIRLVANAVGQSAEHVKSFFNMLRTELAFYVGCVNLHETLALKKQPMRFPAPAAAEECRLSFSGLYDVCLALSMDQHVVGNDANADGKDLVIVTGANTGGKSVFMRSVGLAQLMMQSGMFVPAESFCASVRDGLFTHYKREGSEIARQILTALLDQRVRIVCVTHLYELAHGFYERDAAKVLFLRAERQASGTRTYKLLEGMPLRTSFGEDLYDSIFGTEPDVDINRAARRSQPAPGTTPLHDPGSPTHAMPKAGRG